MCAATEIVLFRTVHGCRARPQTGVTTAPSRPSRREDVLMLQTWLQEMMAQTLAQVGSRGADAASSDDAASDAISAVADKVGKWLRCWLSIAASYVSQG